MHDIDIQWGERAQLSLHNKSLGNELWIKSALVNVTTWVRRDLSEGNREVTSLSVYLDFGSPFDIFRRS